MLWRVDDMEKFSLVKPTLSTPFHIDFDWWKQHDNNWRVHLLSCLCTEHKATYKDSPDDLIIDWVNPETAEVLPVDGLQHTLISHCSTEPDFLTEKTSLVEATFRILLISGNKPLTPLELEEKTGKTARTILRTLSGSKVYMGIRPRQI